MIWIPISITLIACALLISTLRNESGWFALPPLDAVMLYVPWIGFWPLMAWVIYLLTYR